MQSSEQTCPKGITVSIWVITDTEDPVLFSLLLLFSIAEKSALKYGGVIPDPVFQNFYFSCEARLKGIEKRKIPSVLGPESLPFLCRTLSLTEC